MISGLAVSLQWKELVPAVTHGIIHGQREKFYLTIRQGGSDKQEEGEISLDVRQPEQNVEVDVGELLQDDVNSEASLADELALLMEEEAEAALDLEESNARDADGVPIGPPNSPSRPANYEEDVVGERWGCFTITPVRRRGRHGLVLVGYQARCPWHRLNQLTDCKKAFGLVRTQESRSDILQRLFHWCTLALEKPRQSHHMQEACPLALCPPMEVIRARRLEEGPERGLVYTDAELDSLGVPLDICPPASFEVAAAAAARAKQGNGVSSGDPAQERVAPKPKLQSVGGAKAKAKAKSSSASQSAHEQTSRAKPACSAAPPASRGERRTCCNLQVRKGGVLFSGRFRIGLCVHTGAW